MKKLFNILSFLTIASTFAFAQEDLNKCAPKFTITCDHPFASVNAPDAQIKKFSYKKAGKLIYVALVWRQNQNPNEWEKFAVDVTPSQDAEVRISVSALQDESKKNKSDKKFAVLVDDIKVNDSLVKNGDFENGLNSHSYTKNKGLQAKVETSPKYVKFGKKCVSLCSSTYITNQYNVAKGKTINFSVMTKPRGSIRSDYDIPLDFANQTNATPPYKADNSSGEVVFETIRFDATKSIDLKNNLTLDIADKLHTGKYLYLLHAYENLTDQDKTHKAVIVITTTSDKKIYKDLFVGKDILDTNAYKPAHNAKAVYFADKQNKKGAVYLSKFEIDTEEPIKSIIFKSKNAGLWKIFASTISDKNIMPYETWRPTPDQWKPADIQKNNIVIKGSVLDLAHFFHDGEAGNYGRIIVSERGTFAFENLPDQDVRLKSASINTFYGDLSDKPKRYQRLKEYAELIKRSGYNCVRINFDFIRDPSRANMLDANMDMLDYFMAELKKNGIYIHYVLAWNDLGLKKTSKTYERDEMKLRCIFLEPEAVKGWQHWATYLLNHVNPYTKLALKDDPQIVQFEYFNEFSIAIPRINRAPAHIQDYLYNQFRTWLKQKYKTIENLNNAWNVDGFYSKKGGSKYKSFDEVKDALGHNHDWIFFAAQSRSEFFRICTETVRKTGYKGIIASENMGGNASSVPIRNRYFDSIICNTYYSHPAGLNTPKVSCSQKSSIGLGFDNISNLVYNHFNDRPAGITEYNYCLWNQHRYEMPTTYPLYSSYQDYSMITIFEDSVPNIDAMEMKYRHELSPFRIRNSPILRASEIFTTSMYIRRDITPTKPTVEIDMSNENLKALPSAIRRFDELQPKLALLTGVRIKTEGERPSVLKKVKVPTPLITLKPKCENRLITFEKWLDKLASGEDNWTTLTQEVEKLRAHGVLDKANKTDLAKGIFHSDTKEILLDAKNKMVKVVTPKTEIVSAKVLKNQKLGSLNVISSSIPASVGVTTLDHKDIKGSNRLVFAYLTQEANSKMELSFDQFYLVRMGKAPILLRTGTVQAELKLDPNKTYKVYPISLNGQRRAEIPCDFKNGVLKININTHTLPNGPTTIFEIVANNGK